MTFLLVVKLLHGDTPPNQANQATVKPYTAKNGYATNVSSSALAEWPEWQRVLHRDFAFALLTTKCVSFRYLWNSSQTAHFAGSPGSFLLSSKICFLYSHEFASDLSSSLALRAENSILAWSGP